MKHVLLSGTDMPVVHGEFVTDVALGVSFSNNRKTEDPTCLLSNLSSVPESFSGRPRFLSDDAVAL